MSRKSPKMQIEANKKAKQIIESLNRSKNISYQQLYENIKQYVGNKFMLSGDDFYTEDILELAKISLARQLDVNLQKLKKIDIADCSGATSSMTKKVLLIMSIEKNLNIEFSGEEFSGIENITGLCNRIKEKRY